MAKRRDSSSELTPEDFLESRQEDSDSPNPVLDIIRNVDAARDEEGADGEGMSGARPATITETSSEAPWDSAQTAEKDGDSTGTATAADGGTDSPAADSSADDDEERQDGDDEFVAQAEQNSFVEQAFRLDVGGVFVCFVRHDRRL